MLGCRRKAPESSRLYRVLAVFLPLGIIVERRGPWNFVNHLCVGAIGSDHSSSNIAGGILRAKIVRLRQEGKPVLWFRSTYFGVIDGVTNGVTGRVR